ncbi:hypothetical protein D3C80_1687560 [compost metagenome]
MAGCIEQLGIRQHAQQGVIVMPCHLAQLAQDGFLYGRLGNQVQGYEGFTPIPGSQNLLHELTETLPGLIVLPVMTLVLAEALVRECQRQFFCPVCRMAQPAQRVGSLEGHAVGDGAGR